MKTLLQHYNELLAVAPETPNKWPGRAITDKGTYHCFIQQYYTHKFSSLKDAPISLLELGVEHGYSMDLWLSWFTNGNFIGIDPFQPNTIEKFNSISNCKGYDLDGYIESTVNLFEDNQFDFIIEDGPHTLESQVFAAQHWPAKLKSGGLLIIEDIQDPNKDVPEILKAVEGNKNLQVLFYDLRNIQGRHDDVILEIQKR